MNHSWSGCNHGWVGNGWCPQCFPCYDKPMQSPPSYFLPIRDTNSNLETALRLLLEAAKILEEFKNERCRRGFNPVAKERK